MPRLLRRGPDAISPTAHYTGHIWVRNGLSHPELATHEGRVFFAALQPAMRLSRARGGPTLESSLIARHRTINRLLTDAIEFGGVTQVVEIACGMSPRGWRFGERYGSRLTYVEADLPAMAERKRHALRRIGSLGPHHRVADLDALRDAGPESLAELAETLDPGQGLALVTEGLLPYLDRAAVLGLWRRCAAVGARFKEARYLSDLRLAGSNSGRAERAFYVFLSAFVRGRVQVHFADEGEACAALEDAGFADARLERGDAGADPLVAKLGPGAELIHVIDARVGETV